jgi:RNA polymerase sigma-70 factor, ECF subfamily
MTKSQQTLNSQFEDSTFCYMKQLFRLAYSRTGNRQDAEDILQETYLKAWRSFGSVRQPESTKNWLTQILINTIHDFRRKAQRTIETVDIADLDEDAVQEQVSASPEDQICRDEIDSSLSEALQSIPQAFLTPLLLREIYESSYDEIAHSLDIPIGTVMSRLYRARALLRNALLAHEKSDETKAGNRCDVATEENQKRGSC